MPNMDRLFIGRHGHVNLDDELSGEGQADAVNMSGQLYGHGFNHSGIIVSSIAQRAIQTAKIIRDRTEIPTMVRSEYIELAGMHPEPVRDLRSFVGKILDACNVRHAKSDVVVITHYPLVQAVSGRTAYGQVYEVPKDWQNPQFRPDFEYLLDNPEFWRG